MTAPRRGSGGSPSRRGGTPGDGRRGGSRGGTGRSASGGSGGSFRNGGGSGRSAAGSAGGWSSGGGRGDRPQRPTGGHRGRPDDEAGEGPRRSGAPSGGQQATPRRDGERSGWQDRRPGPASSDRRGRPERDGDRSRGAGVAGDRGRGTGRPGRRDDGGTSTWRDRRPEGERGGSTGRSWEGRRASGQRPERGDRDRGADRGRSNWRDRRPGDDRRSGSGRPQGDRPQRTPLPPGPELPEWADPRQLDNSVRAALRALEPRNADRVARHLVAAGTLLEEDPAAALSHAHAARDRASRVAAVREAVGVAAYHAGDYAEAARELRAYRRMSGDESYRAVLADCERALGRPEVALRLIAEALADSPDRDERIELRLVEAGARRELGEGPAARLVLEDALGGAQQPQGLSASDPGRLRLAAAYADLLRAEGDAERADAWTAAVAAADEDDVTGLGGPDVLFDDDPLEDAVDEDLEDGAEDEVEVEDDPADDLAVTEGPRSGIPAVAFSDDISDDDVEITDDVEAEVAELLGEDHPLAHVDDDGRSTGR